MLEIIFFLIAGCAFLYLGAELLVRGSSRIALHYRVSPLVIGLTLVAFGTSSPELVVSLISGIKGIGNIAIGNVIGSNIFNIAVIIGLASIIRPIVVEHKAIIFDTPIMLGVSVIFSLMLLDLKISRLEAGLLLGGIILYILVTFYLSKRNKLQIEVEEISEVKQQKFNLLLNLFFVIAGLGLLVLGSELFVDGASKLARAVGISEAVIGLTIVASGTSLPELATSIVASIKKEHAIAVGNIIGSNIFNILAITGTAGLFNPLVADKITLLDIGFMLGTALALLLFMLVGKRINRFKGIIFLVSYLTYLYFLWPK